MNINLNNSDEPRLIPSDVVYENKASLKKRATVLPLYGTAAAAAAVALLLFLLWPRPNHPALELTAELKPLAAEWVAVGDDQPVLREMKQPPVAYPKEVRQSSNTVHRSEAKPHRTELPLLASMPETSSDKAWAEVTGGYALANDATASLVILTQSSLEDESLAWTPEGNVYDDVAEWFLERGFYRFPDVESYEFGSIFLQGWRTLKTELAQLNESVGNGFRQLKQIPPPPSVHSYF